MPKGTPTWLTVSILLLGGALGLSISIEALLALYGFTGFLSNLFFPHAGFHISSIEAIYLGVVGVCAALSATLLSYLAVYMNGLSKKAIRLSQIVAIPLTSTAILVAISHMTENFDYSFSGLWVAGAIMSIIFGGILPWLLLRTKAGRKVHNK